jgi:hypothetical protein
MKVKIGDAVGAGAREAGNRRVSSDVQAGSAMKNPGAQVLTLFGPPSICIPSIAVVAVMAATEPNTRNTGVR